MENSNVNKSLRSTKAKKEREYKRLTVIQNTLLIFLAIVILYPFIKNQQFSGRIQQEIREFRQSDRTEQVANMESVNQEIHDRGNFYTTDPFHSEVQYEDTAEMLGVLNIPKIDEELSVYDRTDNISLSEGVGLLEGTHQPTGGINNTTVLTGHDGMAEADIFRHLDKLDSGDTFTFDNGVEVLTYQVYESIIVLPHETEHIQQIPGQDTMILLTCDTPDFTKGLNTHRRIVYGRRIPTEKLPEVAETGNKVTKGNTRYNVFGVLGIVVLGYAVYTVVIDVRGKKED